MGRGKYVAGAALVGGLVGAWLMRKRTAAEVADKAYGLACFAQAPFRGGAREEDSHPSFDPRANWCFVKNDPTMRLGERIVALDWNVERGRHAGDVVARLSRVRDAHPDLGFIALQEAPDPRTSGFYKDPVFDGFSVLFAPESYHGVTDRARPFAWNKEREDVTMTGNALLSRYPIGNFNIVPLPKVSWNYHSDAVLRYNTVIARSHGVAFAVSHWEPYTNLSDRRLHAVRTVDALQFDDDITLLGVDANLVDLEAEPAYGTMRRAGFVDAHPGRTPDRFADYLFVRGPITEEGPHQDLKIRASREEGLEPGHPLLLAEIYR